jgi:activator of 2-hydroxyglutaryl-CoA dehydratase
MAEPELRAGVDPGSSDTDGVVVKDNEESS